MDYVVRPLPSVTAELASVERAIQNEFQSILAAIAMNPFPNPQFPFLTEDWATDGSPILTYSDGAFPYAIHLVRFEPLDNELGLLVVIRLARLGRRR